MSRLLNDLIKEKNFKSIDDYFSFDFKEDSPAIEIKYLKKGENFIKKKLKDPLFDLKEYFLEFMNEVIESSLKEDEVKKPAKKRAAKKKKK
jgi:hypothetical protein